MKGMALDTKDRYSSATEMLKDMEEFRKDPAVIFVFHKPRVSDATQAVDLAGINRQTRTTAEKVAGRKSGESGSLRGAGAAAAGAGAMRQRSPGSTGRSHGTNSASRNTGSAAARRKRREQEEEEKRSRFTTIAIVSCCAVAVIAIIILLIAIMNGGFTSQQPELASVPNLVGKVYESLPVIENFEIELDVPRYDETVPKGQIIEQNPLAGDSVVKGSTIRVVVSLGEEPTVKVMENILGTKQEVAESFLRGQGFEPLVWEEASDDYPEGTVIRTDPVAGTELEEGQTIKLYISSGPAVKKVNMPSVIGMNYATAHQTLTNMGFTNVEPRPVPSNETKDEVVGQSVVKDTMVDVTTHIILDISEGPDESSAPSTEPTQETTEPTDATEETTEPTGTTDATNATEPTQNTVGGEERTVMRTLSLPERDTPYIVYLYYDGMQITEGKQINPGDELLVTVSLTGTGVRTYVVKIGDEVYTTFEVDFSEVDG